MCVAPARARAIACNASTSEVVAFCTTTLRHVAAGCSEHGLGTASCAKGCDASAGPLPCLTSSRRCLLPLDGVSYVLPPFLYSHCCSIFFACGLQSRLCFMMAHAGAACTAIPRSSWRRAAALSSSSLPDNVLMSCFHSSLLRPPNLGSNYDGDLLADERRQILAAEALLFVTVRANGVVYSDDSLERTAIIVWV